MQLQHTLHYKRDNLLLRILLIGFSILLILLFFRLWLGNGSYTEIWRMQEQIAARKAANKAQVEANSKLQAEVEEFKTRDTIVEEHARSELGFIRKGETFYQVIMQDKPIPAPDTENKANNPHNKSTGKEDKVYE